MATALKADDEKSSVGSNPTRIVYAELAERLNAAAC